MLSPRFSKFSRKENGGNCDLCFPNAVGGSARGSNTTRCYPTSTLDLDRLRALVLQSISSWFPITSTCGLARVSPDRQASPTIGGLNNVAFVLFAPSLFNSAIDIDSSICIKNKISEAAVRGKTFRLMEIVAVGFVYVGIPESKSYCSEAPRRIRRPAASKLPMLEPGDISSSLIRKASRAWIIDLFRGSQKHPDIRQ